MDGHDLGRSIERGVGCLMMAVASLLLCAAVLGGLLVWRW